MNNFTMLKTSPKIRYAAFGSFNTTIGEPNVRTGAMSLAVGLIAFNSVAARDKFVDEFSDAGATARKTNRTDARQYFLGMSVDDYNDAIDQCDNVLFING